MKKKNINDKFFINIKSIPLFTSNFRYYFIILFFASIIAINNKISYAELSYSFTQDKTVNGNRKNKTNNNNDVNSEKQNDIKNENLNNVNNQNVKNESNQEKVGDDDKNEIKLKIGGLADFQYFYTQQESEYKRDILPNGLPYSPQTLHNYHIFNDNNSTINMLGKIDINPEFVRYSNHPITKEKVKVLSIGAKISQPFYNASKNTDPKLAPQEYIYANTKYLHIEFGATASPSSKMRVDSQKLASGNGGVFGTWWRYVSLPVFDTTNITGQNLVVLNAISPVYILYPTLPNEAGFTVQRTNLGQQINSSSFKNGVINEYNLINGATAQGYPTQGAYSNKVAIYLNRIYGFKVGVSYSPTTEHTGYITRGINKGSMFFNNVSGGFVKNYTSVAMDYRKQFDKYNLAFAIYLTYEHGDSGAMRYYYENNGKYNSINLSNSKYYNRRNLNAWAIGGQLLWKNYTIAYSYGDWGHSLLPKSEVKTDNEYQIAQPIKKSYYHTAGFGANYGPVRLGITYIRSSYSGNKLDAWSIGTDFKMISLRYLKVNPYFEYVGYIFHTQDINLISGDNRTYRASATKGYVITTGIRIVF